MANFVFRCIFTHKNASIKLIFNTINLILFLYICKKGVLILWGYEFFRLISFICVDLIRLNTALAVDYLIKFSINRLETTAKSRMSKNLLSAKKIALFAKNFANVPYVFVQIRHFSYLSNRYMLEYGLQGLSRPKLLKLGNNSLIQGKISTGNLKRFHGEAHKKACSLFTNRQAFYKHRLCDQFSLNWP